MGDTCYFTYTCTCKGGGCRRISPWQQKLSTCTHLLYLSVDMAEEILKASWNDAPKLVGERVTLVRRPWGNYMLIITR